MSGRFQRRIRAAFIGAPDRLWTTGELVRMARPDRPRFDNHEYSRAREIAAQYADPIGYARRGRMSRSPGGLLWKKRDP